MLKKYCQEISFFFNNTRQIGAMILVFYTV